MADILGAVLGPVVDVESGTVSACRGVPAPVKAIFNLKTEDMVPVTGEDGKPVYEKAPGENRPAKVVRRAKTLEKPILASKVFFEDGSWTLVKNSGDDTVDVEEKKLSNGKTVKVATDASKERALAYAVVKRAFGSVDPGTGEVKGANLGRRFAKVLEASVDQNVSGAVRGAPKAGKTAEKKSEKKPCGGKCRRGGEFDPEKFGDFVKGLVSEIVSGLERARRAEAGEEAERGA